MNRAAMRRSMSSGTGCAPGTQAARIRRDALQRKRLQQEPQVHRFERVALRFATGEVEHPAARQQDDAASVRPMDALDTVIDLVDGRPHPLAAPRHRSPRGNGRSCRVRRRRAEGRRSSAPTTRSRPVAVMRTSAHPASSASDADTESVEGSLERFHDVELDDRRPVRPANGNTVRCRGRTSRSRRRRHGGREPSDW